MKIQIENESLVKDIDTGAVIETDAGKLKKHRAIRNALKRREKSIDVLIEKINKLEQQLERMTDGKHNV